MNIITNIKLYDYNFIYIINSTKISHSCDEIYISFHQKFKVNLDIDDFIYDEIRITDHNIEEMVNVILDCVIWSK